MACAGNSSEVCGGGNRLTVFYNGKGGPVVNPGPPGWGALGCYTDAGTRTLTTGMGVAGGASKMTVALCTAACQGAGYSLAGVEYADECYCGNTFSNGGGPAPDGASGCNMVCAGNSSEYCGGPNRLDVYKLGATPTSQSAAPASTSSAAPANGGGTTSIGNNQNPTQASDGPTKLTTPAQPSLTVVQSAAATGLPKGWSAKGCYVDSVNGRILGTQVPSDNTMSIESCVSSCAANGYSVAGAEYGAQCFCGNMIIEGGSPDTANPNGCNMACAGNSGETCGGPNRMNIFSNFTGTVPAIGPPQTQKTGLPGNWQYVGCLR